MKTAMTTLTALVVLFTADSAICAESEPMDGRPFMGVLIDPAPLPNLLSKHLGLPLGQGLRIQNVQENSPADKAGLERDDLVIGFEGQDVHVHEVFVDAIRKAGAGAEVSLQIIHLGVRKTVKLTLKPFKSGADWKYPREPEAVQSWRPGRFFRLRPGDKDWKEMFRDNIPPDFDVDVRRFFNELYSYHHSDGEDDIVITIEGSPNDEDSTITVRVGGDKYTTTVKEIDKLPEKYRRAAEKALEDARRDSQRRRSGERFRVLPWRGPQDWRDYFGRLDPRDYAPMPRFDRSDEIFDRIQKQMREMRDRLDDLEKRYRDKLDGLRDERDRKELKKEGESTSSNVEDQQKV